MSAFLVCFGLLISLSEEPSPPTSQPAFPDFEDVWWLKSPYLELQAALDKAAKSVEIEGVLEIEASLGGGGLVEWSVNFEIDPAWNRFERMGFMKDVDSRLRWYSWYEEINSELLATTKAVMSRSHALVSDPREYGRVNVEIDVSVEINAEHSEVARFRGSRPVYLVRPPEGMETWPKPGKDNLVDGVRLQVELAPDRMSWREHETIEGKYQLKNTGSHRITIRPEDLPHPYLLDSKNKPPQSFPSRMMICGGGGWMNSPPIILQPGEVSERWFSIDTDPLGRTGGTLVTSGRYTLNFGSLADQLNIATDVKPVPLVVFPPEEAERIVLWFAAKQRLVVVRESGRVEVFGLDEMNKVFETRIEGFDVLSGYASSVIFAPDAGALAWVQRVPAWNPKPEVHICELGKSGRRHVVSVEDGSFHLLQFDGSPRRILAHSDGRLLEIDGASKRVTVSANLRGYPDVSPDGKHILCYEEDTFVSSRDSILPERKLDWPDDIWTSSLAFSGIFIKRQNARMSLYDYRGQLMREFETHAHAFVCESASGRYAVFSIEKEAFGCENNQLEVWDTQEARRFATLPADTRRTAYLVESPLRVVCAKTRTHPDDCTGPVWYARTFEIFDAMSGRLLKTLKLPEPPPTD